MPSPKIASLSLINYITGISDGLILPVIPCVLIQAYYEGSMPQKIVLFSFIACFGGLVYGLARYFGEKNEIAHNHPDIANGEMEKDAVLLKRIGIEEDLITDMMQQAGKEQAQWLNEIRENKMTWETADPGRAKISGIQTGIGFCAGSCVIAVPLFAFFSNHLSLILCFALEGILLFLFGWLKGKWIGKTPLRLAMIQVIKGFMVMSLMALLLWASPAGSIE